MKEPYIKPEIKSEKLEPETLINAGSPIGEPGDGDNGGWLGGGGWGGRRRRRGSWGWGN